MYGWLNLGQILHFGDKINISSHGYCNSYGHQAGTTVIIVGIPQGLRRDGNIGIEPSNYTGMERGLGM